ncbi:MAG: hypothetical protein Ta2B_27220 [Termitinemataceae bacterium]|nr:MAG: hypothetical protein Ta2B_27220 [Termitinemataceae bacterium]
MKKVAFLAVAMAALLGTAVFAQEKVGLNVEFGIDLDNLTQKDYGDNQNIKVILPYFIFSTTVGQFTVDAEAGTNWSLAKDANIPVALDNAFLQLTYNITEPLNAWVRSGDTGPIALGASYDVSTVKIGAEFQTWDGGHLGEGYNWAIVPQVDFAAGDIFGYVKAILPIRDGLDIDQYGGGPAPDLNLFFGATALDDFLAAVDEYFKGMSDPYDKNLSLQARIGGNFGAVTARVTLKVPLFEDGFKGAGMLIQPYVKCDINESFYAYLDAKIMNVGNDSDTDIGFQPKIMLGVKL